MNGKKSRKLRKWSLSMVTHGNKKFETTYVNSKGKTQILEKGCHRSCYQSLKKSYLDSSRERNFIIA